jgi:formamidopyrimidine-DNA glycosylase
MPELPEVEIITRELRAGLIGEKIIGYEVKWYKTLQVHDHFPLISREIKGLDRKGKYIIFILDMGFLVAHLRMTGKFIINNSDKYSQDHLQVVFHLTSNKNLLYYDIRKFGRIFVTCNTDKILKNVGLDFLNSALTVNIFSSYFQTGEKKIKSFLMNQKYFAGLGNIYTDESLFKAKLHPAITMNRLSAINIKHLYHAIKETLLKAIDNKGTTIANYKTTENNSGRNQNHLYVYQREHKPCFHCGGIIKRIKVNNRSTYFCPDCQKI